VALVVVLVEKWLLVVWRRRRWWKIGRWRRRSRMKWIVDFVSWRGRGRRVVLPFLVVVLCGLVLCVRFWVEGGRFLCFAGGQNVVTVVWEKGCV